MLSRLNSRMLSYASKIRDHTPEHVSIDPEEVAGMPGLWICPGSRSRGSRQSSRGSAPQQNPGRAKSAHPWPRWGAGRSTAPDQAAARAHSVGHALAGATSLASLAESMRSEERSRRGMSKELPRRALMGHKGFNEELLSLCQQSARSRQVSKDFSESRASSVNFMAPDPAHVSGGSSGNSSRDWGGARGLGLRTTKSLEIHRSIGLDGAQRSIDSHSSNSGAKLVSPADSATTAGHTFFLSMSRAGSLEIEARPSSVAAPSHGAGEGARTGVKPMMARANSGPPTLLSSPRDIAEGNKGKQTPPGSRLTRQLSGDLMSLRQGKHASQPLIPIRSGEVELFIRGQSLRQKERSLSGLSPPVPEQAASPQISTTADAIGTVMAPEGGPDGGVPAGAGLPPPAKIAEQRATAALVASKQVHSLESLAAGVSVSAYHIAPAFCLL